MGRILLVTGGSRSGKSRYAQARAEALPPPHLFVATCPPLDDELRQRIARHRADRQARGWQTLETATDLRGALAAVGAATVLVDCLTLWTSNLLLAAEHDGRDFTEDDMTAAANAVAAVARQRAGTTIFVTNEVGLGIVPDNPLARRFRDLAGRGNQALAAAADEVVLLVSGLPLTLKPKANA
jgi:adenosylcobinamide kinase/adenosylcobinamide-phosphate guanylyltransferase